ncbi:OBAP family protein [Salinimicrobium sp. GXAS 041]|uniref:OBAP family protein n=1 Tax=Salinimicrobium sp. GXAS 041 TaxID=3400806 RepID=UPI003C715510
MRTINHFVAVFISAVMITSCGEDRKSDTEVPGRDESTKTNVLETGSNLIQTKAPFDPMEVYLVGFHPMKEDPGHQMEAHHFCTQVNEDFAQCALFDGNTEDAKLTGIEYIISEKLFESLPEEEKQYWHPHNYEILSGQLVAPGLPDVAEMELMDSKMNSYGKTWHVWSSDKDDLPLGDPMLAWSFNRDGEVQPRLVEKRDEAMDIETQDKREERKELISRANPQEGVDAIKDKFPGPTKLIPGVKNKNSKDTMQ